MGSLNVHSSMPVFCRKNLKSLAAKIPGNNVSNIFFVIGNKNFYHTGNSPSLLKKLRLIYFSIIQNYGMDKAKFGIVSYDKFFAIENCHIYATLIQYNQTRWQWVNKMMVGGVKR